MIAQDLKLRATPLKITIDLRVLSPSRPPSRSMLTGRSLLHQTYSFLSWATLASSLFTFSRCLELLSKAIFKSISMFFSVLRHFSNLNRTISLSYGHPPVDRRCRPPCGQKRPSAASHQPTSLRARRRWVARSRLCCCSSRARGSILTSPTDSFKARSSRVYCSSCFLNFSASV